MKRKKKRKPPKLSDVLALILLAFEIFKWLYSLVRKE